VKTGIKILPVKKTFLYLCSFGSSIKYADKKAIYTARFAQDTEHEEKKIVKNKM